MKQLAAGRGEAGHLRGNGGVRTVAVRRHGLVFHAHSGEERLVDFECRPMAVAVGSSADLRDRTEVNIIRINLPRSQN